MIINETLSTIMARRSVRAYKPDPIPQDVLTAILDAGKAAPYVMPESRHFSVIRDRSMINRLSEDAKAEGMKLSDAHRELFGAPGFDGTYGAPVVIVLSGMKDSVQYESVCAASVMNMLTAAKSLSIGSCWVYYPIFAFHGAAAGAWRGSLRIPDGYEPCAAVLLGYSAEEPAVGADDRYKNAITLV